MPDDDRIYMFMLDFSDNEKPGKILHRIAALSQETIQAICNGKVFINHDDVIWGMLSYSSIQSGNNYAIDVAKQLRLTLTQFMSCEIKISLASEDKNSFDLVSLYDKCRKTLYRAFVEAGDVFTWKPVKNPNAKKEIKRIIENFGKDIGYNELINKLTDISNILTNSPIIPPIQIKRIYEMIISSYVQRFPDYNNLLSTLIEGYDTLRKYLRSSNNLPDLLFRATTILNELNSSRPDTEDLMITNIKNYIKSNINFKISFLII